MNISTCKALMLAWGKDIGTIFTEYEFPSATYKMTQSRWKTDDEIARPSET